MNQKIPERIPVIRIDVSARAQSLVSRYVLQTGPHNQKQPTKTPELKNRAHLHILHTAPQARLNRVGIPAEDVHDEGPAKAGEDRPGASLDLGACGGGEEGVG
jgi:hypothetical protein